MRLTNFSRKYFATAAALLLAAGGIALADMKSGDVFPDLTKYKLEGKLPDSTKDKVVLVDFWASWCVPCKDSFPTMNELQKKYADRGLVIIAINVDEKRADMDVFLKAHPASFIVVRDAAQKLVDLTGIVTMPSSFLLDRAGKVRYLHNGFHGEKTKQEYVTEIESLLAK
jgi:thiol-disulfide isomerase/thioredoxin